MRHPQRGDLGTLVVTPTGQISLLSISQLLQSTKIATKFYDFEALSKVGVSKVNTGSFSQPANQGGFVRYTTGSTASSFYRTMFQDTANFQYTIAPNDVHYMIARVRVPTTPDAQTMLELGWADGINNWVAGNHLTIGVRGSQSTTLFCVHGNGGAAFNIAGATIDTNWHTLELWRVGGTTFARMDGGAASSGTADVSATGGFLGFHVENQATAATQQLDIAWQAYGIVYK